MFDWENISSLRVTDTESITKKLARSDLPRKYFNTLKKYFK